MKKKSGEGHRTSCKKPGRVTAKIRNVLAQKRHEAAVAFDKGVTDDTEATEKATSKDDITDDEDPVDNQKKRYELVKQSRQLRESPAPSDEERQRTRVQ